MSLITKRLKLFIDKKRIKVTNLEKEIGLPNSTLSRPLKEGKSIKTDTLEKVLRTEPFRNMHPIWLVTGKGEIELDATTINDVNAIERESLINILSNFIHFPITQQTEIKEILEFYIDRIIAEIQEVTASNDDLKEDIEGYKKDLKTMQILAENRQENKILKKENEELKKQVKLLKSSTN